MVTCDRAKMYWRVERLQWCWAHLKRDFQGLIDTGDKRAKWLGQRLRCATCKLFEHWADFRSPNRSRSRGEIHSHRLGAGFNSSMPSNCTHSCSSGLRDTPNPLCRGFGVAGSAGAEGRDPFPSSCGRLGQTCQDDRWRSVGEKGAAARCGNP